MLILADAAFVIGAYLWGAIPSAYLVAKYAKGIDIREFGSGNVGASNVTRHVGKLPGFLQGLFDFAAKGILPVALAGILERDDAVRAAVGLAAIAGHNWSPYLRFTGGRGVAAAIGAVLGFGMWPEFFILLASVGAIGILLKRDTGFWTLVAVVALPMLAYLFDRPTEVLIMCAGIFVLLIAKRLTANWEPLPAGTQALQVLALRALFDRDVPRQESWTERRPGSVE